MKTTENFLALLMMFSESLSRSIDLNVPLKALSGSRKLVYAGPEETVMFNCSITGVTDPSFRWTLNDSLLREENRILLVEGVSESHEGEYTCFVTSGIGTLRSETLTLRLAEMRSTSGRRTRGKDDVDLLKCDVPQYSVPPAQILWFRNQKSLDVIPENMYTDINGSLVFMYKSQDDRYAMYKCMATNTILNSSVKGESVYFRSQSKYARHQTRPIPLRYGPESVTGVEGDDVVLECVFKGDPIPEISWKKAGFYEPVVNSRYVTLMRNKLVFSKVQVSDAGNYTCVARNTKGEETKSFQLLVKARASAKVVPESTTVLAGSDVLLRCAQPSGYVQWYIDGTSFQNVDKGFDESNYLNLTEDKSSLTIHPAGNRTNGLCVQCYVTDDRSYSLYSACVKYVESVDQLPTTTTYSIVKTTPASTMVADSHPEQMPVWTIIIATLAGVFVVSAAIVITVLLIRKQRRGRKKNKDSRVSTVSCTLPNRTSILCEINLLEDKF